MAKSLRSSNAHLSTTPYWRPMGTDLLRAHLGLTSTDDSSFQFAIARAAQPEVPIGIAELHACDFRHAVGQIGITIWSAEDRGQHLGGRALLLLCRWAFSEANLRRLWATVFVSNTPSLQLFDRVGFIREGTLREHRLQDGAPNDLAVLGLLRTDFDDLLIGPDPWDNA